MEPDIHSTLPEGSPLLAYGTSRESRFKDATWLLAIGAGILVGLTLIIGTIVIATRKVALPKGIVALAVVPKTATLPSGFPRVWREAANGSSAILGITKVNNTYVPFALIPTLSWKNNFFKLTSEAPLETPTSLSVYRLARLMQHGSKAPYLELRNGENDIHSGPTLSGTIKDTIWTTSLEASTSSKQNLPAQDLALDLSAFPESFAPIAEALEGRVTGINTIPRPDILGWSELADGNFSLELAYEGEIPKTTRTIFSVAAGDFTTIPYHLSDETLVEEIRPLDTGSIATTGTSPIFITQNSIRLGEVAAAPSTDEACGEHLLARFRGNILLFIVERLNVPFVIPADTTLLVGEEKGKVIVCWR